MAIYRRMEELGISLPEPPEKGGVYTPVKRFCGNLAYVSGCGPKTGGKDRYLGVVGKDLTVEEGQEAAKATILNLLAVLHRELGDLNRIKSFVKLLAFVVCEPGFDQQPLVVNACSELLVGLFGEEDGCPARSAVGVTALPGNIPVEIEALIEMK